MAIVKYLSFILISFLMIGCPTYDPPTGALSIANLGSETVYVYLSCDTTLPKKPALKLYFVSGNEFDEAGDSKKGEIFYPNYRIETDSVGYLRVWGTPEHPQIPCEDPSMSLFFITETVMKKFTWEEIVDGRHYKTKMKFTEQQFDSMGWKVNYFL